MRIINSDVTKGCTLKCFKTKCNDRYYMVIENSYLGDRCYISSGGELFIRHSVFAPEVFVGTYKHVFPRQSSNHIDLNYRIVIEDSVFIGQKSSIVGDVTVGKGSVIGAGSVVTKSISDCSIAVGNPARVIKIWDSTSKEWKKVNAK